MQVRLGLSRLLRRTSHSEGKGRHTDSRRLNDIPDRISTTPWRPPSKAPAARHEEVHLWRASLVRTRLQIQLLLEALAPEERERAAQFRFQKDREHFIAARGLLRAVLASYLKTEPGQVRFSYGPNGKPALACECGSHALRFNMSHSHDLALCAVTCERAIGVDVEFISPDQTPQQTEQIAERFFSLREARAIRRLPRRKRISAFFRRWTLKEAFVKATGKGLSLPLNQFEVMPAPGHRAALTSAQMSAEELSRWSLRSVLVGPEYAAAVVAEGRGWRLKYREWPREWIAFEAVERR